MRHAPDNLIKEEPSAGGVGEGLGLRLLIGFTCPAITVVTVILRALGVRERALGCFARSPKSPHARQALRRGDFLNPRCLSTVFFPGTRLSQLQYESSLEYGCF